MEFKLFSTQRSKIEEHLCPLISSNSDKNYNQTMAFVLEQVKHQLLLGVLWKCFIPRNMHERLETC